MPLFFWMLLGMIGSAASAVGGAAAAVGGAVAGAAGAVGGAVASTASAVGGAVSQGAAAVGNAIAGPASGSVGGAGSGGGAAGALTALTDVASAAPSPSSALGAGGTPLETISPTINPAPTSGIVTNTEGVSVGTEAELGVKGQPIPTVDPASLASTPTSGTVVNTEGVSLGTEAELGFKGQPLPTSASPTPTITGAGKSIGPTTPTTAISAETLASTPTSIPSAPAGSGLLTPLTTATTPPGLIERLNAFLEDFGEKPAVKLAKNLKELAGKAPDEPEPLQTGPPSPEQSISPVERTSIPSLSRATTVTSPIELNLAASDKPPLDLDQLQGLQTQSILSLIAELRTQRRLF